MFKVDMSLDALPASSGVRELVKKHIPFVIARTATLLAQRVKKGTITVMQKRLDQPTPRRYRVILTVGVYSGRRVRRRGRVSALQIADKEKPAMGISGLKGMFSRSWGNPKRPSVKGM